MTTKIGSATWRRLLDATAVLHAHEEGTFEERIFRATRLVFGDTCHGFESFGDDGSHAKASDIPWPEARIDDFVRRSGEVVPQEHPMFPRLLAGEMRPMRLSDLASDRNVRRTNYYNDLWKPVDVRYQIVIPLASPGAITCLSIMRGGRDFSDDDMSAASLFARHLSLAWGTTRVLHGISKRNPQASLEPDLVRRHGLSARERDVLGWLVEGKRNAEIALILAISPRTVEVHLTSVFRKLGVENRTSAVAMMTRRR